MVDICRSHPYRWCDSAKRRMKCFVASDPRGLLLAVFPNNFRGVFRASGCAVRGHCGLQADLPKPTTGNRLEHWCEVHTKTKADDTKGVL